MAKVDEYAIRLKPDAIAAISAHLRRGIYSDVVGLLNDLARQVDEQNHAAEQAELQKHVAAAGIRLADEHGGDVNIVGYSDDPAKAA